MGKCFLKKKLATDEDQQQSTGRSAHQEDTEVELFLQEQPRINFLLPTLINQHNLFYLNGKPQEFISSFFQPPRC